MPDLTLRMVQANRDGINAYLYEIAGANLGDLSPTRTVLDTDASHAVSLMKDANFPFHDVAIVHDESLTGLTRAIRGDVLREGRRADPRGE